MQRAAYSTQITSGSVDDDCYHGDRKILGIVIGKLLSWPSGLNLRIFQKNGCKARFTEGF